MGEQVYNPQKWKSGGVVASTAGAAVAFSSAAFITMRYPIANVVNKFQASIIKDAVSLLSSTESEKFFRIFNANSLIDLQSSLTSRQVSSLTSILSTQKGIDVLTVFLTNPELAKHLRGIMSINPEGIKIIQQIFNNSATLSSLKAIFTSDTNLAALRKILSNNKGLSTLLEFLSTGKELSGILPSIKATGLQGAFETLNNQGPMEVLKAILINNNAINQEAVIALKDIIANPKELQAFKAMLTATGPNSELFKNLINAQALNVQPTVAPSSYLGLMLAALVLVMVIAIVGTILTTRNNHDKIESGEKLTKKDMIPNMVFAGLLGVSLVGTALFVILEIEKFQILFKTPVMQNHAIMGGTVIGLMALALVLGIVTTLCAEKLTDPSACLKDCTHRKGCPNNLVTA